jgi:SAM-dependent methyltransferase
MMQDPSVVEEPTFRTDLFRGTAEYYDRYRLPYPAALFDDLRARVPVTGTGRLLDLACGTGQIAFPLEKEFREVWAVDQEPDAIALVVAKAERLELRHLHAVVGAAEDLTFDDPFELIGIGNAFHRLRRTRVAELVASWLRPGGCVALVGGGSPRHGRRPWQRAMDDLLTRWMHTAGAADRIPDGWEEALARDPNEAVLGRAGLAYQGTFDFDVTYRWTIDELVGHVYSTSFLNRRALGDRVDAFERDLRDTLLACEPEGVFVDDTQFGYELARRPA